MVNDKKTSILIEPETADEFFDRFRESSTTKMGRFVLSYPSWMAESLLWDKEEHDIDSEFERLTRQLAALDEKIDQEREKTAHEKELKRKADEEKKRLEEEAKKKEAEAKEKLEKEKAAKKAQEAADKKAKPPADKGAKEPSPDKSKNTDSKKTLNSKEPTKKSAPSTKK
jgi:Skp family chaperone for outer membrane proteins